MKYSNLFSAFFFITCILLASCHDNAKEVTKHSEFELSANPGGILYLDSTRTIHIATTLYNPTNDTLSFVSMSCSFEDLFLTDTSIFRVQSRYDCYSNYPKVISVPPREKIDQFIMVRPVNKDIKIADYKIRIGMYYLTPKKENGFQGRVKQYEQRQTAKIIWSNELDLRRLYRMIYK